MEMHPFKQNTELTNYMPVPRAVLELNLPFSAVVVYGMLLDRGTLSRKNGYTDENGWIYVAYPVLEVAHVLGISPTSVKKTMKLLEEAGLIRRLRRSRKDANRIFLMLPSDAVLTDTGRDTRRDRKEGCEGQKTDSVRETIVAPNNIKKQHNRNNIYQHKQEESL